MIISFWRRLLDLISPRLCVVCGHRLTVTEEVICTKCNFHLPRTDFHHNAYENEMAKLFWYLIPIERATAYFYYEPHSSTANIIYQMKYKDHPEIGEVMGRMMGKELMPSGFFDGIDGIIPIPLTKKRQRQRGYNQSKVEKVFELIDGTTIQGKHLLIVDDVVTTGATCIACSKELVKAGDVKISILSLGFAKS